MFSGSELWATNEPARDRSSVFKPINTTQTDIEGVHCLRFDSEYVKVTVFNPTIYNLPDGAAVLFSDNPTPSARFLFWTIYHVFM